MPPLPFRGGGAPSLATLLLAGAVFLPFIVHYLYMKDYKARRLYIKLNTVQTIEQRQQIRAKINEHFKNKPIPNHKHVWKKLDNLDQKN